MKTKRYDIKSKIDNWCGFYEWNKPTFYVKKKDERYQKFIDQKKECGFTDEETWSLYNNIALFIAPRLKRFIEIIEDGVGTPVGFTQEEWINILNKMLFSFEKLADENKVYSDEEYQKIQEGMNLFGQHFMSLWW